MGAMAFKSKDLSVAARILQDQIPRFDDEWVRYGALGSKKATQSDQGESVVAERRRERGNLWAQLGNLLYEQATELVRTRASVVETSTEEEEQNALATIAELFSNAT